MSFNSQAVTPVDDRRARYVFSWSPHVRHGDAALRDTLMGIAGAASAAVRAAAPAADDA